MTTEEKVDAVLLDIRGEVLRAMSKHPPLNSPHEGYAVILEELDELWDEVKPNQGRSVNAQVEAVQVAAMAARYIIDLCLTTEKGGE